MNPPCIRCKKTAYPTERLNCLDKIWHKLCFNCETCGMNLTMKTYKGYQKLPYCRTHYPSTKFTAVADTPENLRLAETTKQQSSVNYHKDFEAEKGEFTSVADDPETLRMNRSQQQASSSAKGEEVKKKPANRRITAPPASTYPGKQTDGPKYVATYDYNAADEDEVSFLEGDAIIEVTVIDDGWMEGRVERTGQFGMIPSNYAEKK